MNMTEFHFGKHKWLAEEAEKNCYRTSLVLGIITSLAYLIFHPFMGNSDKLPTIYLFNYLSDFRIIVHITTFIAMVLIIYVQLIPVYCSFYITWSAQIHYFRLEEYIETNLCKKYNSFDIIESANEQDLIYFHLKKCTHFHLLLKQ